MRARQGISSSKEELRKASLSIRLTLHVHGLFS